MNRLWMLRHVFVVSLLLFATASTPNAQTPQLGKVEFPTTGSPQAQANFLRGLAAALKQVLVDGRLVGSMLLPLARRSAGR